MHYFILIVCFMFIRPLIAKDINISSIIILDQNIPKECGINISVVDEDVFNTKVLIKCPHINIYLNLLRILLCDFI